MGRSPTYGRRDHRKVLAVSKEYLGYSGRLSIEVICCDSWGWNFVQRSLYLYLYTPLLSRHPPLILHTTSLKKMKIIILSRYSTSYTYFTFYTDLRGTTDLRASKHYQSAMKMSNQWRCAPPRHHIEPYQYEKLKKKLDIACSPLTEYHNFHLHRNWFGDVVGC
jgi:hypothetical protein